ncbi:MAG: 50S ribosomal protein L16 [Nanobdellota archaeon]
MAKLRKGSAYRKVERPYTRKSKYRSLSFVRSTPVCKITRFDSGAKSQNFQKKVVLKTKEEGQFRHNCLESARMTVQRSLDKVLNKDEYSFRIKIYPHHHLRENPLASGAGADRMSTGMKKSFGKVIGLAARVRKGQEIMEVKASQKNIDKAKKSLQKANFKLPKKCVAVVK